MTELSEASRAALGSARQELKRVLELAGETTTLADLRSLLDETKAKCRVTKFEHLGDLASQGFGDLYKVECDEQGNPILPGTDEMPNGFGQLIKMCKRTEDPNVVRIVFLPFEQYPDVYELEWTVEILQDMIGDH